MNKILWLKVLAIAAIQASITLTWVVYNLYIVDLLIKNFGFSKELATLLLIVENGLEAIIEPIFGAYSDRQKQNLGTRIPIINIGIILSSALFIAIPALVIFVDPQTIWRWTLPAIAVAWASAMAIFRSPAMALLGNAAPKDKLPQAASILTLVGQLVGAFRFDVYGIIVGLGANFAFAIGSFSLLIAAAFLRLVYPPQPRLKIEEETPAIAWNLLFLILGTGFGIGWGLRFLIPSINKVLATQLETGEVKLAMTLVFIALGLSALPAGKIATAIGNFKAILLGILATIIFLQLLVLNNNNLIIFSLLTAIIFSFSLVLNGIIPFVLNITPETYTGLGTGMYFAGLTASFSLFEVFLAKFGEITPTTGAMGAAIALLLTFLLIILSMQKVEGVGSRD